MSDEVARQLDPRRETRARAELDRRPTHYQVQREHQGDSNWSGGKWAGRSQGDGNLSDRKWGGRDR